MSGTDSIGDLYERVAHRFDRDRGKSLVERAYLEAALEGHPRGADVLDLGCGTGEPIARFFVEAGCRVTGIDVAPAMLGLCRSRFPAMQWLERDMRSLDLGARFDVLVAWDSFFHLPHDDQRAMFAVFARHAAPGASLLFTSGTGHGIALGSLYGAELYHASLAPEEYRTVLESHGFTTALHREQDPDCGEHTVWLARYAREGGAQA